MIRRQLSVLGFGLITTSIIHPLPSLAHSTSVNYQITEAIAIEATFDNGKPMVNAQVVVYAPDNPSIPWQQGLTDKQGKFTFVPDFNNQGNWSVKVRSAGHGKIIDIPIQSSAEVQDIQTQTKMSSSVAETAEAFSPNQAKLEQNKALSLSQKLVMAAMGGWGFVGTALFFSRKNKTIN